MLEKCGSVDETSTPYSLNRNEKVSSQRGDQTCTLVFADSRQSDPSDCNETRVCDRKSTEQRTRCRIQQDDQQKAL